ncbi:FKBP-type peptidyl-prolyl cis-trans isomerase [Aureitalea sp. L0-47]|uniref:FKBP-type peptidyl-prolyl cis-trans isomerase n=1 Tax=Aureitalea sp. L0-47 TaxID=2816962 RepID=UPI002237A585|nr:FKBP-type peptidyl-prolyl cis-trans isomerase [Aureitalea sp. L0-47]MCW5521037.1 FKBP-type peptidyl-prolyl cis-trans isomerase [Aureitalea sp. L0-47]
MKFKLIFTFFILCGVMMYSQEQVTESGIAYKLIEAGAEIVPDDHRIMMRFTHRNTKDSIYLGNLTDKYPAYFRKAMFADKPGKVEEIIYNARIGDSIEIRTSVKNILDPLPPGVDSTEVWTSNFRVVGSASNEEYREHRKQLIIDMRPDDDKDGMKQFSEDIALIEAYLKENKIEAQRTESGLFYKIWEEGSGDRVRAGDTIRTEYTGFLLSTGFHFDTSLETVAKEHGLYSPRRTYEPLKSVIGKGMLISGWDEGFQLLRKGDKASFYIPSILAYGPRELSEDIPANSIMIFDVELVEIIRVDD